MCNHVSIQCKQMFVHDSFRICKVCKPANTSTVITLQKVSKLTATVNIFLDSRNRSCGMLPGTKCRPRSSHRQPEVDKLTEREDFGLDQTEMGCFIGDKSWENAGREKLKK